MKTLLALFLAAASAHAQVTLTHVHGLAYSPDGKRLMIPSHHGLAVYEAGGWSKAPGPEHDYMGFSATASAIDSSGHPAPGSNLVNPFGLLRSKDGGKTWEKLALEGESDFHVMATSWNTHAVYVWNPQPNSRMKQAGLHHTRNDGFSWTRAAAKGFDGHPYARAVHPDDAKSVAMAAANGVFVSRDAGEHFSRLSKVQGTAVMFDLDGTHLWYGSYGEEARLSRLPLTGARAAVLKLPPLTQDAVAFIAQNPARRSEYALATFKRDVYLSADSGRTGRRSPSVGRPGKFGA